MDTACEDVSKFEIISPNSSQNENCFGQKLQVVRDNQNTFYVQHFSENHGIYGIMWKSMVEPYRPQMKL